MATTIVKLLDADGAVARCGNGTLDPGEQCDDGNQTGGDGCERDCLHTLCVGGVTIVEPKLTQRSKGNGVVLTIKGELPFLPGGLPGYDPATSGAQVYIQGAIDPPGCPAGSAQGLVTFKAVDERITRSRIKFTAKLKQFGDDVVLDTQPSAPCA